VALIAALVAGQGVTRMLFDCRNTERDPALERRLAEVIAEAARTTPNRSSNVVQAASAFSTSRPVTLPSRRRIRAS